MPHLGQSAYSLGGSFLIYLHSGYPEQAINGPKRPRFFTRGLPQSGHFSSKAFSWIIFPSFEISFVFLHSGYPEHAINRPNRPILITMGLPHFSQTSLVASSVMSFLESTSSFSSRFLMNGS